MPDAVRSPLVNYHLSQGTALSEYHGALVPLRFEGPQAEYAAVRGAAGLFDFSHRAKFAVRGADCVRFLQGMVTNDVKMLAPAREPTRRSSTPKGISSLTCASTGRRQRT